MPPNKGFWLSICCNFISLINKKTLPMKKILLLAVLAGGLGFSVKAQAQPQVTGNPDPNAPVMTFETDTMNFGTVTQGTIVERDYKFTNTGKEPLIITGAQGSCHCTVPSYPTEPIAPGKTGVIHVRFDSNGKMNYQDKQATIMSNNKNGNVVLSLRGTVIAAPATNTGPTPGGTPDPNRGAAPTGGN
jgi:hypothetical protein